MIKNEFIKQIRKFDKEDLIEYLIESYVFNDTNFEGILEDLYAMYGE